MRSSEMNWWVAAIVVVVVVVSRIEWIIDVWKRR